jgi:hypothetical protein
VVSDRTELTNSNKAAFAADFRPPVSGAVRPTRGRGYHLAFAHKPQWEISLAKGRNSLVRASKKRARSIPRLRTHGTPPEAIRATWRKDLATSSVVGTFLGRPTVKGKYRREAALVCLVDRKLEPSELPEGQRIRSHVRWAEGQRQRRLATDVVQITRLVELQALLGPSEEVRRTGERASTGMAIMHSEFSACVTTAGHSLLPDSPDGTVTVFEGGSGIPVHVCKRIQNGSNDYALLQSPDKSVPVGNTTSSGVQLGPVYVPTLDDLGTSLYVVDGRGNWTRVSCIGIHAHLPIDDATGFEDVILTDPKTTAGQSGSCLVDSNARIWGVLIGIYSGLYSIFMPAINLLTNEAATLL